MSGSIEFNADKLIKKLNLIEKAYLPQAAEQALKSFGFESRKTLADEMRNRYGTATNYTLKSPRFVHKGLDLTIYINDDQSQNQSAAEYLFPTDSSDGPRQSRLSPRPSLASSRASTAPTKSQCQCPAPGQAGSSSPRTATSRARRFRA